MLISRISAVIFQCRERSLLHHIGQVLFEGLGEEFPSSLAGSLSAVKAILNVVGIQDFNPPVQELLPRIVPILKCRNDVVQENCIDIVGRIADGGSHYVTVKE